MRLVGTLSHCIIIFNIFCINSLPPDGRERYTQQVFYYREIGVEFSRHMLLLVQRGASITVYRADSLLSVGGYCFVSGDLRRVYSVSRERERERAGPRQGEVSACVWSLLPRAAGVDTCSAWQGTTLPAPCLRI